MEILTDERGWFGLQGEWIVFGEHGRLLMAAPSIMSGLVCEVVQGGERIMELFLVPIRNEGLNRRRVGWRDDRMYVKLTSFEGNHLISSACAF